MGQTQHTNAHPAFFKGSFGSLQVFAAIISGFCHFQMRTYLLNKDAGTRFVPGSALLVLVTLLCAYVKAFNESCTCHPSHTTEARL